MHKEYIEFLKAEIKEYDKELISMLELPSVASLRARIKKDKRDTKEMLALYRSMTYCDRCIRSVKAQMRRCNDRSQKLLGHKLQRPVRKYNKSQIGFVSLKNEKVMV